MRQVDIQPHAQEVIDRRAVRLLIQGERDVHRYRQQREIPDIKLAVPKILDIAHVGECLVVGVDLDHLAVNPRRDQARGAVDANRRRGRTAPGGFVFRVPVEEEDRPMGIDGQRGFVAGLTALESDTGGRHGRDQSLQVSFVPRPRPAGDVVDGPEYGGDLGDEPVFNYRK